MRNSIILTAIAAVVGVTAVAAIAGAWSMSHKTASKGAPTEVLAPMSPHDMMVKQGSSLPVEYWAHPF